MKLATTIAAALLALLPGFALAECRGEHSDQTAASCLPGTTWDAATGTCSENPSS
jgi:hypothetical protein